MYTNNQIQRSILKNKIKDSENYFVSEHELLFKKKKC